MTIVPFSKSTHNTTPTCQLLIVVLNTAAHPTTGTSEFALFILLSNESQNLDGVQRKLFTNVPH